RHRRDVAGTGRPQKSVGLGHGLRLFCHSSTASVGCKLWAGLAVPMAAESSCGGAGDGIWRSNDNHSSSNKSATVSVCTVGDTQQITHSLYRTSKLNTAREWRFRRRWKRLVENFPTTRRVICTSSKIDPASVVPSVTYGMCLRVCYVLRSTLQYIPYQASERYILDIQPPAECAIKTT
ncbi:unnamed protein product, partial [Ectocarpus sp. 12 AP-2014]